MNVLFDRKRSWGTYCLSGFPALLLKLCQLTSSFRFIHRVSVWLRHPLKHGLEQPVDTCLWGLKLRFMPRGNLSESRVLFTPGLFDPLERAFLKAKLEPGAVFLDIGSNAGAYSFWVFSVLKHQCSIFAVEPDPELQERIAYNAATNQVKNLKLFPCALSNEVGQMAMVFSEKNRGQNVLSEERDSGDQMVDVRTLNDLVDEHAIHRIDALKIDVEGHEARIMKHFFAHAAQTNWPRWIICETCTEEQAGDMGALLFSSGYQKVLCGKMNGIFAFGE